MAQLTKQQEFEALERELLAQELAVEIDKREKAAQIDVIPEDARRVNTEGLTIRQLEVLHYLIDRIEADGIAPTVSEMCRDLGFKSQNTASQMLTQLEQRGKIIKFRGKARGIQLVYEPTGGSLTDHIKGVLNGCLLSSETRGELQRILARTEQCR